MGMLEKLRELETELESMTQEEFDAKFADKISKLDFSEDDKYKDDSGLVILGLDDCVDVSVDLEITVGESSKYKITTPSHGNNHDLCVLAA